MNVAKFSSKAGSSFKVAILIKSSSFNQNNLETYYVNELALQGIQPEDVMAMDLPYGNNN